MVRFFVSKAMARKPADDTSPACIHIDRAVVEWCARMTFYVGFALGAVLGAFASEVLPLLLP